MNPKVALGDLTSGLAQGPKQRSFHRATMSGSCTSIPHAGVNDTRRAPSLAALLLAGSLLAAAFLPAAVALDGAQCEGKPPMTPLLYGADFEIADNICCHNTHWCPSSLLRVRPARACCKPAAGMCEAVAMSSCRETPLGPRASVYLTRTQSIQHGC